MTQAEIEELIDEYQSSFPMPYVLLVLGYAFILLIDRVLIDSHTVEPASKDESATETVDTEAVERAFNSRADIS